MFSCLSTAVVGQGFVAVNITFENTAGPINHQAVAVRNGADLSTFYSCSFHGYTYTRSDNSTENATFMAQSNSYLETQQQFSRILTYTQNSLYKISSTQSQNKALEGVLEDCLRPKFHRWVRESVRMKRMVGSSYAEFNNMGPGSNTSGRVTRPGFHVIDAIDAANFTVSAFLLGDNWLPQTGVPYFSGLL
ncbi:hypothetical protein BC332_14521 [Capsicum chinense]|nr:hypothetical protein BC332_14521 [Capsicum chinense]